MKKKDKKMVKDLSVFLVVMNFIMIKEINYQRL